MNRIISDVKTGQILAKNSGSAMIMAMCALMVIFVFALSFLSVATSSITSATRSDMSSRALEVAEAGVEKAIYYLKNTAPDGSTGGSWRTEHAAADHSGDVWHEESLATDEIFKLCVRTAAGTNQNRIVITSVGTVTHGDASLSKTIEVVIERDAENVSPWHNVIFGGVGQAGKSINGNVRMRGSVHLLGDGEDFTDVDGDKRWDDNESFTDQNHNGQYDFGEPYTDVDHDGHRDAREPFIDANGNGTRDPALTVTDLAEDISGTADIGNNYNGMPAAISSKIPTIPMTSFGGESVGSLSAKLRVKHGRVSISGSASVGYANVAGNGVKETVDGTFVSDGYGGNKGASSVYSDSGTAKGYDLGEDLVQFPALIDPYPPYATYQDYLAANSYVSTGQMDIGSTTFTKGDAKGSISFDKNTKVMEVHGIVYVNGTVNLNTDIVYKGGGTIVSTGDINVHGNLLPQTKFPSTDKLGLVAAHNMGIATGGGDSQLNLAFAGYAQYKITMAKQCEFAGTIVSSFFAMSNVPHLYQVPALSTCLPPGMPGGDPIWITSISVKSWRDLKNP